MPLTQALLGRVIKKAAAPDQTWAQYIDMLCAMLCITDRSLVIDSARAVVHVHFTQLGRHHLMDIPFNDILQAVNGQAKTAPDTSQGPRVTSPGTLKGGTVHVATAPP